MNAAQIVSIVVAISAIVTLFKLYKAAQCCEGLMTRREEFKVKIGMAFMILTASAQFYQGINDSPIAFIWIKIVSIFSIFNERAFIKTLDKYRQK